MENQIYSGQKDILLILKSLIITLVLFIVLFHLLSSFYGYPIYRDIHLGTAIIYSQTEINLFNPVIAGFNATQTPTPQELPIWQALAALSLKYIGPWWGWTNLISLILFFLSIYPVYRIAKSEINREAAYWTLLFLLSQPLIWQQSGRAGTDGFCFTLAIWLFFAGYKLLQKPNYWVLIVTTIISILAAISKLPFMLFSFIGLFIYTFWKYEFNYLRWSMLIIVIFITGIAFIFWTQYTDNCIAQAEFGYVDLRVSKNPQMLWWYIGDWAYRLNPFYWVKGAWRAFNALFGSFFLFVPFALSLLIKKKFNISLILLLAGVITTLIFSHLVLTHHNYFLIFSFPIALILGELISSISFYFSKQSYRIKLLSILIIFIGLCFSVIQGIIGLEMVINYDPYPKKIASIIKNYTNKSSKVLIQGGGWGGNYLLLSDRNGLSIWNTEFLNNSKNLARLKELGYNQLVMISESPLMESLQKTNPGSANYKRDLYTKYLVGKPNNWPTIFQNEDLLIKQIP